MSTTETPPEQRVDLRGALQRLENACSERARLLSADAYNMAILTDGMKEALYELDEARRQARAALAQAPAAKPTCNCTAYCGQYIQHGHCHAYPAAVTVQPLAQPLVAEPRTVNRLSADELLSVWRKHYPQSVPGQLTANVLLDVQAKLAAAWGVQLAR